jgi:hypothetical protein
MVVFVFAAKDGIQKGLKLNSDKMLPFPLNTILSAFCALISIPSPLISLYAKVRVISVKAHVQFVIFNDQRLFIVRFYVHPLFRFEFLV